MRRRVVASEKESGLEMADLSMSSGHGRAWERASLIWSWRREMNARKAGVGVMVVSEVVVVVVVVIVAGVVVGVEIGRIGGAVVAI